MKSCLRILLICLPLCFPLSPTLCLSENCNLHRLPPSSSSPPPSTSSTSPSTSTTKWNNQSVKAGREAKEHNKRVHFNLETLNSYQLQAPTPGPERGRRGLVGSPPTQLCSNGGPNLSLSLVLSPPVCSGHSTPWEEELRDLQGRIEEFRGQLRAALARRAELQRTLVRQRFGQPQTSSASNPTTNTLTKDINRGR